MNMAFNTKAVDIELLNERRKQKLIRELINTEKSFLNHLDLILDCYVKPLKERRLLEDRKIDCIFNSIYTIKLINTALFNSLIDNVDNDLINSFLQFAPYLKVYSIYASNFTNSQNLLIHEREKSKQFDIFIRNQECSPQGNGLTLESLLITPIQRIPRYKLLLEQLLSLSKQSQKNETYIKNLNNAILLVEQAATHINEAIRDHENFRKLLDIQKKFASKTNPNILVVPFRRFIKEGKLFKVSSKGKSLERIVHLFSDIIMYSKYTSKSTPIYQNVDVENPQVDKLKCCCIMPIQHCTAEIIFGVSPTTGALFQVRCKQDNFFFYSDSSHDVELWINEINVAKELYKRNLKTLKKESSRKKTLKRTSLAKHAKLIRNQQKALRKKILNKTHLNEPIQFNTSIIKPLNCVNLFKRFRKSKHTVKRCSSNKRILWSRKQKKRLSNENKNKKLESSETSLKFPSTVSTAGSLKSNLTETTSISSTDPMSTIEFKKCLTQDKKSCAIQ